MNFFKLKMLTPENVLFEGNVSSLKVMLNDGGIEILASHIPSIAYLSSGECKIILEDGSKKTFVSHDGILNIERSRVTLSSDFLEWSENLSATIQEKQKPISLEKERRSESFSQHQLGSLDLIKTFIKKNKDENI